MGPFPGGWEVIIVSLGEPHGNTAKDLYTTSTYYFPSATMGNLWEDNCAEMLADMPLSLQI